MSIEFLAPCKERRTKGIGGCTSNLGSSILPGVISLFSLGLSPSILRIGNLLIHLFALSAQGRRLPKTIAIDETERKEGKN